MALATAVWAGVKGGVAGETADEVASVAALVVALVVALLTAGCATWTGAGFARFRSLVHLAISTGAVSRRRTPASQSGIPKCASLKISSMGGGSAMPAASSV